MGNGGRKASGSSKHSKPRVPDGESHPIHGGSKDTITYSSRDHVAVINHNKKREEDGAPRSGDAMSSEYNKSKSYRPKK